MVLGTWGEDIKDAGRRSLMMLLLHYSILGYFGLTLSVHTCKHGSLECRHLVSSLEPFAVPVPPFATPSLESKRF